MNVFNIIGPIMIGPSSSHTAGAVRIGRVARKLLGEAPVKAEIGLCGSFAQTYKGHGTDKALLAGIMNYYPYSPEIRDALRLAEKSGIAYSFYTTEIPGAHANTALLHLTGASGRECTLQGASVGGGNIIIQNINGMAVEFNAQHNTLIVLHRDVAGTIAAVSNSMAYSGMNIGNFRLSRPVRGGEAVMTIEVDGDVSKAAVETLRQLPNVINVVLVRPV